MAAPQARRSVLPWRASRLRCTAIPSWRHLATCSAPRSRWACPFCPDGVADPEGVRGDRHAARGLEDQVARRHLERLLGDLGGDAQEHGRDLFVVVAVGVEPGVGPAVVAQDQVAEAEVLD